MSDKIGEIYTEFQIRLDKLEAGLARAERDAEKSAQSIQNKFSRAKVSIDTTLFKKNITELESMQTKLKAKLEEKFSIKADAASITRTQNALKVVEDKIKSIKGEASGMGASFGNLPGVAAGVLTLAGAVGALWSAVGKSADMEGYKTSLKVMLGGADQAQARLEELINFAASTPYEIPQVVQLGNQLQAVGRYSKETMTNLGDLAAAAGKPLEQVAGAFSKLASGQKGIAVDMFRDMLITTTDWVDATGRGVSKTGELLATTEEMLNAIPKILEKKKFSGMMEEQSKTLKGQLSNTADAAGQVATAFGDKLAPSVKSFTSMAIPALSGLKGNVDLIVTTVKIAGVAFIGYELAVNGVTVAKKAAAVATRILDGSIKSLNATMAKNPYALIAVALAAAAFAAYELNEAYGNTIENQEKAIASSKKANVAEQERISGLIKARSATKDASTEYEKIYSSYVKLEKGSKESKRAEEDMHRILVEQQKLYPTLITNTYDYAGNVDKIKLASKQAVVDVKSLTGELTAQQKALASINLASANLELSKAAEAVSKNFRVLGMTTVAEKPFKILFDEIRTGKKTIQDALPELEKLQGQYASWAALGGENTEFNYKVAQDLTAFIDAARKKVEASEVVNGGKGVDANAAKEAARKKAEAVADENERALNERKFLLDMMKESYQKEMEAEKLHHEEQLTKIAKDKLSNKAIEAEAQRHIDAMKSIQNKIDRIQPGKEVSMGEGLMRPANGSKFNKGRVDGVDTRTADEAVQSDKATQLEEWKSEMDTMQAVSDSATASITNNFSSAISGWITDGISFTESMKVGFKGMANSFIADVVRMMTQWAAFSAIKGVVGFFTGGVGTAVVEGAGTAFGHDGGSFIGTPTGVRRAASGADFIVPNGYPNDSYPLFVETGERVQVTKASDVSRQSVDMSGVIRKLDVLNANLMSGGRSKTQTIDVGVTGSLDGKDIGLAGRKSMRIYNRTR